MGKGKERKKLEQIFATNNNSPLSLRCAAAEYEFAYDAPIGFPKHIGKQHLWAVPTLHAPSARQHGSSSSSGSNSLQMRIKFPCWSIAEPGIEWELLCMAGVGRGGWRMEDVLPATCCSCYPRDRFPTGCNRQRDRERGSALKGLRILGTCKGNSPLCPLSV